MSVVLSVAYPFVVGAELDFEYYVNIHTPLVREVWEPEAVNVSKGVEAPGGGDPAFVVLAEIVFASRAALDEALASPRTGEVFADVAKFTTIEPVAQIGERLT